MAKRTLKNCSLIKNYSYLKQRKPRQENGKCEGYGFLNPNGMQYTCSKCKLFSKELSET